jgi:DNA-binding transcriptional ArsR family regulator
MMLELNSRFARGRGRLLPEGGYTEPFLHAVVTAVGDPQVAFGVDGEPHLVAQPELPFPRSVGAEFADEFAALAELLYPLVVLVADEDVARRIDGDRAGRRELAVALSIGPELAHARPRFGELLHATVGAVTIGYPDLFPPGPPAIPTGVFCTRSTAAVNPLTKWEAAAMAAREEGSRNEGLPLLTALGHPLRRQILRTMVIDLDDPSSPTQIADHLRKPLSNVSYHCRVLAEHGAILMAEQGAVRGVIQHFYSVTIDEEWALEILGLGKNGTNGSPGGELQTR